MIYRELIIHEPKFSRMIKNWIILRSEVPSNKALHSYRKKKLYLKVKYKRESERVKNMWKLEEEGREKIKKEEFRK